MAAKLSDISLRYQLETEDGGNQSCVTHILDSDSLPRHEKWESDKKTIGKGGQGVVVLQRCTSLKAPREAVRAVKVLSCSQDDERKRYVREVDAMVRFSREGRSKYFVKMQGWYLINDDMNICIAMEYMPHGDLHSYLETRHTPLSESDAQQIVRQVLKGLIIMHEEKFAHRDVKPQNVLIQHHPDSKASRPWRVKLADFGFSKSVLASNSNVAVGTYGYMAPELFHRPADGTKLDERKADVWAVGAMAFYLMSKDEGFQSWRSLDFLKTTCRGTKVSLYGGPEPTFRSFWSFRDRTKISSARRPLLTGDGINFIREVTMPEPEHRLRADKAVKHPWLSHLSGKQGRRRKKDRDLAPPVAPKPLSPSQANRLSQRHRRTALTPSKLPTDAGISIAPKEPSHHATVARQQDLSVAEALRAKRPQERSLNSASSTPREDRTVQESENCAEAADASSATHKTSTTTTTADEKSQGNPDDTPQRRQADLLLAAQHGQLQDVKSLVSSGDGVTFPKLKTERALYAAAAKGHVEIMEYLIGREPAIAVGMRGVEALLEACEGGHLAAVKALLDRGADPTMSLVDDYTPLHLAACNGDAELIMLLLDSGAKVNKRDSCRLTALHHAADNLNVGAARVLLEKGAEVNAEALHHGTPLRLARCYTTGAADEMIQLLGEWLNRKRREVEND